MGEDGLDLIRDEDIFDKACNKTGLASTFVAAKAYAYLLSVSFPTSHVMVDVTALPVAIAIRGVKYQILKIDKK